MSETLTYAKMLSAYDRLRNYGARQVPFGGFRIIESVHMTETRPHILFSERTLARVSGGRWWSKVETVPRRDMLKLADGTLVGHPATVAALRATLADRQKAV